MSDEEIVDDALTEMDGHLKAAIHQWYRAKRAMQKLKSKPAQLAETNEEGPHPTGCKCYECDGPFS